MANTLIRWKAYGALIIDGMFHNRSPGDEDIVTLGEAKRLVAAGYAALCKEDNPGVVLAVSVEGKASSSVQTTEEVANVDSVAGFSKASNPGVKQGHNRRRSHSAVPRRSRKLGGEDNGNLRA